MFCMTFCANVKRWQDKSMVSQFKLSIFYIITPMHLRKELGLSRDATSLVMFVLAFPMDATASWLCIKTILIYWQIKSYEYEECLKEQPNSHGRIELYSTCCKRLSMYIIFNITELIPQQKDKTKLVIFLLISLCRNINFKYCSYLMFTF